MSGLRPDYSQFGWGRRRDGGGGGGRLTLAPKYPTLVLGWLNVFNVFNDTYIATIFGPTYLTLLGVMFVIVIAPRRARHFGRPENRDWGSERQVQNAIANVLIPLTFIGWQSFSRFLLCYCIAHRTSFIAVYMFHAIWKPRAVCRLHAMQSADCAATVSMNYMHVCALER